MLKCIKTSASISPIPQVLADDRLKGFYAGADMEKIFQSQMRLFAMVFGNEDMAMDTIKGIDLRRSHMHFTEISPEAKVRAERLMAETEIMFRPVEEGELEKYGLGPDGRPLPVNEI
eukprot:gene19153-25761_t